MLCNSLRWQLVLWCLACVALRQSHWHMLAPHTRVCSEVNTVRTTCTHRRVMEKFLSPSHTQFLLIFIYFTHFSSMQHTVWSVCLSSALYLIPPLTPPTSPAHISVTCHGGVVMLWCVALENTREEGWGKERTRVDKNTSGVHETERREEYMILGEFEQQYGQRERRRKMRNEIRRMLDLI